MFWKVAISLALLASPIAAQDKAFSLQAPDTLVQTGFLKHLLPRFSLKTGVRITVTEGAGDAALGAEGMPVFAQGETVWHFTSPGGEDMDAFQDWLLSEVGKRTIEAFAPDGTPLFSADVGRVQAVETTQITGNVVRGEAVSLSQCGRCHVVNETNRMNAIGSTPSFALMRTFPDWQERFETFFMLRPHPAFTQVTGITEPFPENLPSPIAPIEVSWEDIEAIGAYVGSITPADLGKPIQLQ
ncbi:hypothetical protein Z945_3700 [Sulfitobacter noctilucae]|uniref:hypothetical protein n=1 Tax=Sulfitobacter noctilucae TaxID=1342302 RepID=UPI0004689EF7|nr:hypothetical protein [Sulfitobacter noctilucae]KIN70324.1 hypothetical protein Z945_3700 [Sulfitobacter noctilucae]